MDFFYKKNWKYSVENGFENQFKTVNTQPKKKKKKGRGVHQGGYARVSS